ncbi:hypothetical protein [Escherichia phage phiWec190]|nr:hypothetical protein [Escherichia phage phiWec188]BDU13835.1 hypothetical protein [Escherichia phage phiWec190]
MKAQNAIKLYILASIDYSEYSITEEKEKIAELMRRFKNEYWYPYNQEYYNHNVIRAIASWLQGLPSDINIAFEYWEVDRLLTSWGYISERSSESKIQKERENYWLYLAGVILALSHE